MSLVDPYEPRRMRFLEVATHRDWRIKVYGIAAEGERPPASLVTAAKSTAFDALPDPATASERYGVGILIVHAARTENYAVLDWWFGENMLHHDVFRSAAETPTTFERPVDGPMACVWELYVLGFEREAWIDTVLANPFGPDLEKYLSRHFDAAV